MAAVTSRTRNAKKKSPAKRAAPCVLTLSEVQDIFQRAVVEGDEAIFELIPGNSRTDASELLGVYRYAYVARLVEIIGSDYEYLKARMGDDPFSEMARVYVKVHPSRVANARWMSHGLPEFLAEHASYRDRGQLAELANLERAISDAFDAADDPVATLDDVAKVDPEAWGELLIQVHASARRLNMETNAHAVWTALKEDAPPPPAQDLPQCQQLIVWRQDVTSRVRAMTVEEAMLWDEAIKGASFGACCELSAVYADPDGAALRMAQYLHGWLSAGMISKLKLAR